MSLLDVVKKGYKGWLVESKSTTTHTVEYPGLCIQRWNLQDAGQVQEVMCYVQEKLQGHNISRQIAETFEQSPRWAAENEGQSNNRFTACVGDVVTTVLQKLGHNMAFYCGPASAAEQGIPDFAVKELPAAHGRELFTGEGKTPQVMHSAPSIAGISDTQKGYRTIINCAKQACRYIHTRGHRYGFLTYGTTTFFIKRAGLNTYAFTDGIFCTATNPSARELLVYIALKSVEEGPFIAEGEGQQHTTVVVPHETLQPLPGPQTRSQKRNADAAGMSSGVCTVPGSNADVPREAVQLSSYVLGTGLHGPVKLGRYGRDPAAFKFADTCKQPEMVEMLQHEVAIYDRLSTLQGKVIPTLLAFGYWDYRAVYLIATSVVQGEPPTTAMHAALPAAEQALKAIHALGVAHGDIRPDNILVEQQGVDEPKVWFLDFGRSHVAGAGECLDEIAELHALFRSSDHSETYAF